MTSGLVGLGGGSDFLLLEEAASVVFSVAVLSCVFAATSCLDTNLAFFASGVEVLGSVLDDEDCHGGILQSPEAVLITDSLSGSLALDRIVPSSSVVVIGSVPLVPLGPALSADGDRG